MIIAMMLIHTSMSNHTVSSCSCMVKCSKHLVVATLIRATVCISCLTSDWSS